MWFTHNSSARDKKGGLQSSLWKEALGDPTEHEDDTAGKMEQDTGFGLYFLFSLGSLLQ